MIVNIVPDGKFEKYMYLTLCFADESDREVSKILGVEEKTYYALLKKFKAQQMNPSYDLLDSKDHVFKDKDNCLKCREFIFKNANTSDIKIVFETPKRYMGITFNSIGNYGDLFNYLGLYDGPKVKNRFLKKFKIQGTKAKLEDKQILINYFKEIEKSIDREGKIQESLDTLDERLNKY